MNGNNANYINEKLLDNISIITEKVKKIKVKYLQNSKLTIPQFSVLEAVKRRGSIPLKAIGEELNVTGANITCIVDNLEKENLIKRVSSRQDRRIILAELTEEGEKIINLILPVYNTKIEELFSVFTAEEKENLNKLLEKVGE